MIVKAGRGLKKSDVLQEKSDVFSFLWEISYKTSDKTFFALGFANDSGGWELRNPYFKGCMTPKSISTIKGKDGERLQIFEGFMDFLSWRKLHPEIEADSIVLNSLALLPKPQFGLMSFPFYSGYRTQRFFRSSFRPKIHCFTQVCFRKV